MGFQRSDSLEGGDYTVKTVSFSFSFFLNSKIEKLGKCQVLEKIRGKEWQSWGHTGVGQKGKGLNFRSTRT